MPIAIEIQSAARQSLGLCLHKRSRASLCGGKTNVIFLSVSQLWPQAKAPEFDLSHMTVYAELRVSA